MSELRQDGLTLLASVTLDLDIGTKQTLYTVPVGETCVPVLFVLRGADTSLTTVSFSIGFDANADDVVADSTHTELTTSTLYSVIYAMAGATLGAAGDVLGLLCNTQQGSAASAVMDVFGYTYA